MKKRLRKLIFLKSFNNTRPILILALFLVLIILFVNYEIKKPGNVSAATLNYSEDFTTTTYEDITNTTGIWDTTANQANLLEHQWVTPDEDVIGNTNLSNQNLASGWYQHLVLDNNDTPYVTWAAYDNGAGNSYAYITKWLSGVGWTKMNGQAGHDQLTGNPSYSNTEPQMHLNSSQKPYLVFLNSTVDYFTRWSGSNWEKMNGNLGTEPLNGGQVLPRFGIDSGDNPYEISFDNYGVTFTKWTPSVGWTYMDGTTLGAEKIVNPIPISSFNASDIIVKNDIPYVVYGILESGLQDIYFTKWTTGAGSSICGLSINDCWTNMAGNAKGSENISNSGNGHFLGGSTYNKMKLDSSGNPYIVWEDESTGAGDIYFTRWSGLAWTKMDGTPGVDNLSNSVGESKNPALKLDNSGNPYVVWEDASTGISDIYFTRWSGLAWTKMDGTPGVDNLSNNPVSSTLATLDLNSGSEPYITWWEPSKIQLTRWNNALNAWTDVNGVPGYGSPAGANTASNFGLGIFGDQLVIDSHDNPNIIYRKNFDFYYTKFLTNYAHTSRIQSLNINLGSDYIYYAKISATQTLNGQEIDYYLSNDGGVSWELASLDTWHNFSSVGNDLRWRAVLKTTDTTVTPVISGVSIDYQTRNMLCSLSPQSQDVGGAITVNATINFTPVAGSVQAQFEQNSINYANLTLNSIGGNDYSNSLVTDINHLGQNDVAVVATELATGKTYTCNPSDGTVWVKKTITDIPWHRRSRHEVVSYNGAMYILGGYIGYSGNNMTEDDNGNETNEIWKSINGTDWTLEKEHAAWSGRYWHRVVEYNGKLWLMGGETAAGLVNDVWSSTDGINWTQETASAPWSARYDPAVVVYNNKLWLMGGCIAGNCTTTANDVWSFDGTNWTQETAAAAWPTRVGAQVVNWDPDGTGPLPEKMYIYGGLSLPSTNQYNDVWSSVNGITWTQDAASSTWSIRYGFQIVKFDNGSGEKLWLMGGRNAITTTHYNDFYSSTDGVNWTLFLDPPDSPGTMTQPSKWTNWTPRYYLQAVIFNNKIWVLGGGTRVSGTSLLNDEWSSPDVTNWQLVGLNYDAPYRVRFNTQIIEFLGKLWLFGGLTDGVTVNNDIWSSPDGINWTCEVGNYTPGVEGITCNNPIPVGPPGTYWEARHAHRVFIFNDGSGDKLWLVGGCTDPGVTNCISGSGKQDLWNSSDGIHWTRVLATAPWSARYHPVIEPFNGKIFVIGGLLPGGTYLNDVWYSNDGITWTGPRTANWSARAAARAVVFNDGSGNKLWFMGGYGSTFRKNDVWFTADPTINLNWTQATASAGWQARHGFGIAAYNDKIWVYAGNIGVGFTGYAVTDIWNSTDGINWNKVTDYAQWDGRDFPAFAVFHDQMVMTGGDAHSGRKSDLWASAYDFMHFTTVNGGVIPLSIQGPSAPSNVYCEAISPNTIRWHFTDTATNETGFKLYGPSGLILDSGPEIITDLSYLDETNLQINTQYSNRYVSAFNGAGESALSGPSSCYTLANIPFPPGIREVTSSYIHLTVDSGDHNPLGTEYAIKETSTDKYIDANGIFSDTPIWQTYEGWGGANGIIVTGSASQAVTAQGNVQMALEPFTNYYFVVKARNGDGVETAFSGSTPTLTGLETKETTISASKGVGVNIARNSLSNIFKTAFAQDLGSPESRYMVLLREFSMFLNIILLILIVFFLVSVFNTIKYVAKNQAGKKTFSLIWKVLTRDPAHVFSSHALRDEAGTYQVSFEKHKQFHISSQKNLMRALGVIMLKLIVLGALVYGFIGANHDSRAAGYADNGATVKVGDKLSYIINFNNTSDTVLGISVSVYDTLDPHLEYVEGSGRLKIGTNAETTSGITLSNGTLYFNINILDPSAYGTATFDAIVGPGSEGATISNQAFVSGSNFTTALTNAIANPVAPITAMKYSCDSASGSCSASTTGAYASLAECQEDCAIPQPIRYACNSNTGACFASTAGNYSALSDCQASCAVVPPPCVGEECIPQPPPCTGPECVQPPPCTGPDCGPTPPPVCTVADCGQQPPVTPPIIQPFIEPLMSIPVVSYIIETVNSPEADKAATNYITPTLITVAAINTIPAAILLTSYLLPYLHLIFIEPLLYLFRKKRKKWGVVYNALSKVPVDLAVVRLFRKKDNALIQTRVTDKDGRYILIVKETGQYYLSVTKAGFSFPTKYLSSEKQDSKFIDLYHGEAIEVTEKDATVTANIPLDPVEKKIMPERAVIFGYLMKNLRVFVSYIGLVLAALIFLIYPNWITGVSILFHFLLFIIFLRLIVPKKPKSWGIVYDQKTKEPLHYAVVRIFDLKFNKLLETQVTDGKGRYSFLVSKNEYQLLAEKAGYQKKEIKPVDLINKEEIVSLDLGLIKS